MILMDRADRLSNLHPSLLQQWTLCVLITLNGLCHIDSQGLEEYCHLDVFNATCADDEVIMMQTARYGRMRIGRCLSTSYFVGCNADILPVMDSICSGRQACAIKTLDTELVKFHPCRKDLMPYLEAQYTCISPSDSSSTECLSSGHAATPSPSHGFVLFRLGYDATAGSEKCPWQISVKDGQRIEIRVFKFVALVEDGDDPELAAYRDPCKHSVVFIEAEELQELLLCNVKERGQHVYTSAASTLQLYVQSDAAMLQRNTTVLLEYKAVGCADLGPVKDADIQRTDSTAVVKCRVSQETWHLVCRGNTWIGDVRNCSKQSKDVSSKSERKVSVHHKYTFQYGVLVAVSVGLILGVFIGLMLIICMTVHKKKRRQRKARKGQGGQGTMLCEYRDDKSYSFLPNRRDPYITYMSHSEATSPPCDQTDHVSGNTDHVTTFQFPCDSVQVLDTETPDVIYSPRMPQKQGSALGTCQACKNTQLYSKAIPLYKKIQHKIDCSVENPQRPPASLDPSAIRGAVSTVQGDLYSDKDLFKQRVNSDCQGNTSQV